MPGPIYVAPNRAGLPYTPYLTNAEYTNDPDSLDTSNLVPAGTVQQNADALFAKIIQASSWMDRQVHYILAATQEIETRKVRVRNDGTVRIAARGYPILEINSFLAGPIPSQLASITSTNFPDIWTDENIIEMPVYIVSGQRMSAYGPGSRIYVQYTYVNGYPNTLLKNVTAVNDTQVVLNSALGIYPGSQLTIYDFGQTETIIVDSSYVGGVGVSSTTIPLLAGTKINFIHQPGVSVSGLPATIKKAAILAVSGHIKTRGGGAMIMEAVSEDAVRKEETGESGALEDLAMAAAMLQTFGLRYFA